MLHGSAYDCHAPVFLRFSRPQEEDRMERLDDPLHDEIEEVEIEAPDLGAIHFPDPLPTQPAKANTTLAAAKVAVDTAAPKLAADTAVKAVVASGAAVAVAQALAPPAVSPSGTTVFDDLEASVAEVAVPSARSKEQPAALTPLQKSMEIPHDLADISDLAPPERDIEFTEVEGEDDLDLNLDLDLGFDLEDLQDMEEDAALPDAQSEPVTVTAPPKSTAGPVDMDSDLNFELDLGGLSLRDYSSNRK
jgi:hypothetical protein